MGWRKMQVINDDSVGAIVRLSGRIVASVNDDGVGRILRLSVRIRLVVLANVR